ncbi:MAG TPA: helix-turn-helix domain-containing protein [Sporosarcina psychrophila]|uniref:Helix-turn-helix domain-containing protein n=1 Tax=Sporosarcina psychrophila TaxID=1476 RepID=A0A921FY11_SPOPS|nr:helix-turn-helix domain-containing protein [Sporosarcina psychrophila]
MEVKIQACKDYETSGDTFSALAKKLGVSGTTVRLWYQKYKEHGPGVFSPSNNTQPHSEEFKMSVLVEYKSGKYSVSDLAVKYNLSTGALSRWMQKWYDDIEIKDSISKGDLNTMKSRKTTLEERIEIVKWIIDNNMNYQDAADKYTLNYALVYKWTRAYITNGPEALEYKKRGPKSKADIDVSALSEIDLLMIELEKEKALRKRREFELEVLKKKEAFERQLRYQK